MHKLPRKSSSVRLTFSFCHVCFLLVFSCGSFSLGLRTFYISWNFTKKSFNKILITARRIGVCLINLLFKFFSNMHKWPRTSRGNRFLKTADTGFQKIIRKKILYIFPSPEVVVLQVSSSHSNGRSCKYAPRLSQRKTWLGYPTFKSLGWKIDYARSANA